jgi:diguanylate cyclase (GGDEF)-like protein
MSAQSPPLPETALPAGWREEILRSDETGRVARCWLADGSSVIDKEPLGPRAAARLRHETAIMERLAGVPGVPVLVAASRPGVLSLAGVAGVPLAFALQQGPLALAEVPVFAQRLVTVVAAVHTRGVVHRDINPDNILLAAPSREPRLVGFDLATTFAEELPSFAHQREIAGTLRYLAPEQTGRTGLAVDHRADLYAVGAVLYELVCGRPPFEDDGDDLRLIHDVLVQVPVPLSSVRLGVPPMLSAIVARLLEKEPDRRYQSAEGLARDLAVLRRDPRRFALGEWDFPLRLAAPSRLIGRAGEVAALQLAFDGALAGAAHGVLVSGAAGVGKSTLINALRPVVAARGGWFVTAKCDQYGPDVGAGALIRALRGIGRLLLAEPEAELVTARRRLVSALGPAAGQLTAVLPEFAALLGVPSGVPAGRPGGGPVEDEPVAAQARLAQGVLDLLGAVVSAGRPVVIAVDDLQWADPVTLGLVDALLTGNSPRGLLLVGAYREAEVDGGHPLPPLLARWRELAATGAPLRLANLPPDELATLLAEMLRLPPAEAAGLAAAIGPWTAGNPYDTVELVNTLRRDGVLVLTESGWRWDAGTIKRYVGPGDVLELLMDRIAALPAAARELVRVAACLGGAVPLDLLAAAGDHPVETVRDQLGPAFEDGLLLLDSGGTRPPVGGDTAGETVRFRHDRVQQAAYAGLTAADRTALHLALGRRLARSAGREVAAAEQYLAAGPVTEPAEYQRVIVLHRLAAGSARRVNDYDAVERYLAAAAGLLGELGTPTGDPALIEVGIERHVALYSLGRLAEADTVYHSIAVGCADPVQLTPTSCVQLSSLSQRGRHEDAVGLGLDLLRRLDRPVPGDLEALLPAGLAELAGWAARLDLAADLARPDTAQPRVRAAQRLYNRILPPAFFLGQTALIAWIVIEGQRMWTEYGPSAELAANLSCVGLVAMPRLGDYRIGYRVGQHLLALAATREDEPATSLLRYRHSLHVLPWVEPLEHSVSQARLAREGLLRCGDQQVANYTHLTVLSGQLDCGASLETYSAEIEAALALASRTGNRHNAQAIVAHQELAAALRGTGDAAATAPEPANNPLASGLRHIYRALAAAVFGDADAVARHSEAALAARHFLAGYPIALAYLLRALGLAGLLRRDPARTDLAAELDGVRAWLAARAADAPRNFGHLVKLVDAERAWAGGDYRTAAAAFDQAAEGAAERPWHLALITERAALLHADNGLARTGRQLLGQARELYLAWGAQAKVRQLDAAYPYLAGQAAPAGGQPGSGVNVDAIDMLAILRASQALSSQTNLASLQAAIDEQLTTLTGATGAILVLRNADSEEWFLPAASGASPIPVEEAGRLGLLPVTAFWYAERTREPLLVADAIGDDRFARDRYFAGLARCALLVVPILHQGSARAILLLTNADRSGAFSTDRLDAVMLIAGQLGVSVGNALLYGSLEERVAERTEALAAANRQLEVLSGTDSLTGLANRRRFAQTLAAEWERALRTSSPLGIVMVDVDFFKPYNDRYGHPAGDECLRVVAHTLANSLRISDLVCRYGGEEFTMILPGADPAGALTSAERSRGAVADLGLPHAASEAGIVTISAGAASAIPALGSTTEDLLARADAALYVAKASGRNQARSAHGQAR